ncbi:MAG: peptidylprolyl isomerase [Planctomycetes bacterium]|nr:peptidylprolyl isomerase [Planctomycetota bacterium]
MLLILSLICSSTAFAADESATQAVIHTTAGDIHLVLFPKTAPATVANFVKLAKTKFFDGTSFHRVVPGFVIQGGDPNTKVGGNGPVGAGTQVDAAGKPLLIKAEVGASNPEKHTPGTLAMARGPDLDSASCQFYITLAATPNLDGQYTVFGRVVGDADMAVVTKVKADDRMTVEIVEAGKKADAGAPAKPDAPVKEAPAK